MNVDKICVHVLCQNWITFCRNHQMVPLLRLLDRLRVNCQAVLLVCKPPVNVPFINFHQKRYLLQVTTEQA